MEEYVRAEENVKFRKIDLRKLSYTETFQTMRSEKIALDPWIVLEIEHADKTTEIIEYEQKLEYKYYVLPDKKGFWLPEDVPTEHLWLKDSNGICYKVPSGIATVDGKRIIRVQGGVDNIELCGDEYFCKAVHLVQG